MLLSLSLSPWATLAQVRCRQKGDFALASFDHTAIASYAAPVERPAADVVVVVVGVHKKPQREF